MWIVAGSPTNLPDVVATVNSVLRVFVGDLSFVNPACTGFTTSASEFGLNVGVVLGAIILLSVLSGLRLWWSASSTRRYLSDVGQTEATQEVTEFARHKLLESWVFCLTSIVAFSFEILFVRAINAVHCVQRDGMYRLSVELDQVNGAHAYLFLFADV